MYEGDAPLAERRAQALTLDRDLLRELLGQEELRELLDAGRPRRPRAEPPGARRGAAGATTADQVHDLLRRLGDLSRRRGRGPAPPAAARRRRSTSPSSRPRGARSGRGSPARSAGSRSRTSRATATGSGWRRRRACRRRSWRRRSGALDGLLARWARTHGPFLAADPGAPLGAAGRGGRGRAAPAGRGRDAAERRVPARAAPSASSAIPRCCGCCGGGRWRKLRQEVEPVDPVTLARFLPAWQGVARRRRRSSSRIVGRRRVPRVRRRSSASRRSSTSSPACRSRPRSSSATCCRPASPATSRGCSTSWARWARSRGWGGGASAATTGGSSSTARAASCCARSGRRTASSARRTRSTSGSARTSRRRGASLLPRAVHGVGRRGRTARCSTRCGTWSGPARSPTTRSRRSGRCAGSGPRRTTARARAGCTALGPPEAAGRWSLVGDATDELAATRRRAGHAAPSALHALALALLERHGVVTREAVAGEPIDGGFSAVYPVLRAMEEAGRIRRGYFVDGLGAAQFALPGAVDRLRAMRDQPGELAGDHGRVVHLLAAADPANPYGAALAVAASRRRRPAPVPAGRGRVRRARRRRRGRLSRPRRDVDPDAARGRRPGGARGGPRVAARPRRRRPGPRARDREGRRRARRRLAGPRRAARPGSRRLSRPRWTARYAPPRRRPARLAHGRR